MAKRGTTIGLYAVASLSFIDIIWYSMHNAASAARVKTVPYSEFLNQVRNGNVTKVLIDQTAIKATLKPEAVQKNESNGISTVRLPGIDETSLVKDLEAQNVTFEGHVEDVNWWAGIVSWIIPIL